MPLFRKRLNKSLLEIHKAKRGYGFSKTQQDLFKPAIDRNILLSNLEVKKQLQKRKTGVRSLVRTTINPKAVQRLNRMRRIQKNKIARTNPKRI